MDVKKAQAYYDSIGWVSVPCFGVTEIDGKQHCNCSRGASCQYKGKHPKVSLLKYKDDISKIPKAEIGDNLAVLVGPHSGIVDLECDDPTSVKVLEGLFRGELPETASFKSSRGVHRIFQHDAGLPNKASQKSVELYGGKGLDCLYGNDGKFQYMMVPPSIHPSGIQYKWLKNPKDNPPIALPEYVIRDLAGYENKPKNTNDTVFDRLHAGDVSTVVSELHRIYKEGERHAALMAKAGSYLRFKTKLEAREHKEYLVQWAEQRTTWDLSDKRVQFEILDLINHVITCEERRRRGIATTIQDTEQEDEWEFVKVEDLMRETEEHEYLIDNILVKNEPMVIGAPSKSLKTFCSYDLASSLATATPFLGKFAVERKCKVAYFSAESGRISSRHMICSIWKHKVDDFGLTGDGWHDHFFMRFKTPKIDSIHDLELIKKYVKELDIEVLIIDPLYLSFSSVKDASQIYEMGSAFRTFIEVCASVGVTPILIHHARKSIGSGYMQLEMLSQAGIAEVARQFILLNRRVTFDGKVHKMNMNCGGSAQHHYRGEFDVAANLWKPKFESLDSNATTLELLDCDQVLYDILSLEGRLTSRQLFINVQGDRMDDKGNQLPPFLAAEIYRCLDKMVLERKIQLNGGRYSVPTVD